MLKRPVEPIGDGRKGYSSESLRDIEAALAQQVDALDARIAGVRRELKEAQAVRAELNDDLDYIRRRIAGEKQETLFQERLAARQRRKAEGSEGSDGSDGSDGSEGSEDTAE